MQYRPQLNFERTPATLLMMATIVALELICTIGGPSTRDYYDVRWIGLNPTVWDWQLWRPFTSTLLHGGLLHAVLNLYWLALFGAVLENWWGSLKFTAAVIFVAVATGMIQFVLPDVGQPWSNVGIRGAVGFSGVVFAMFGFLMVARHRYSDLYAVCDNRTVQLMIVWALICIPLTYQRIWPIANLAHFSGLGFGILMAKSLFATRHRSRWFGGFVLAALLALTPMLYAPWVQNYRFVKTHPHGAFEKALVAKYPNYYN